jgi:hypothetical protein
LRAKARYARWREELVIIGDEMGNTIRYYEFQMSEWVRRAEASAEAGQRGHACYAYRQAAMWEGFAVNAKVKFGNNAV